MIEPFSKALDFQPLGRDRRLIFCPADRLGNGDRWNRFGLGLGDHGVLARELFGGVLGRGPAPDVKHEPADHEQEHGEGDKQFAFG